MMHHPNMHHQPMSGHPPQHMAAHQGMPAHHQMPPHQMHRENRHVAIPRLGPPGGMPHGHGPGQAMGAMGMGVPHHGPQRPPHPIRPMHHPPQPHHPVPQQMKPMRRPFVGGGGFSGPPAPPAAFPPRDHPPQDPPRPPPTTQGLHGPMSPLLSKVQASLPPSKLQTDFGRSTSMSAQAPTTSPAVNQTAPPAEPAAPPAEGPKGPTAGAGEGEARVATDGAPQANSKEKTPMCLVNELARYNKIKHQYRLTSETGPAHKKVFTVTLRLGDTEEYTAEGSSIKRAQHAAARAALAGTAFPPPPPRPHHAHHTASHHHRHNGAVMPTVELNALAMKLCQPAVYTCVPAAPPRAPRPRAPAPPYRMGPPFVPPPYRMMNPGIVYRVRVSVGGRAWLGEGATPQAARHDAAARALHDLRPQTQPPPAQVSGTGANGNTESATGEDNGTGDAGADLLTSEVKSPVSLVHELALKRNLTVVFTVKSERGPPHMRVFVTACTVGDLETEGEGNGKKVSKRRAAERMLEEMRRRWPPALLRAPPPDRRRHPPSKKKPRNLIKEGGVCGDGGGGPNSSGGGGGGGGGADNPISRLAVARHTLRARSPQYRVIEERGLARRREFIVQCDAPPHSATGLGPNKKTAKRRAAHNVLLAMEMSANQSENNPSIASNNSEVSASANAEVNKTSPAVTDTKRKEGESPPLGGGANSEVRQPVPGVLLMDYHQRSGQPTQPNGVSESAGTGGAGGSSPGAKDQLMYLAQLLGFTVQFSDFPKRNHGEYLSLVSLSTEPPVMCHGGGPSTQHSHEQCARAALRALKLMGLDGTGMQSLPNQSPKQGVMSNGISE